MLDPAVIIGGYFLISFAYVFVRVEYHYEHEGKWIFFILNLPTIILLWLLLTTALIFAWPISISARRGLIESISPFLTRHIRTRIENYIQASIHRKALEREQRVIRKQKRRAADKESSYFSLWPTSSEWLIREKRIAEERKQQRNLHARARQDQARPAIAAARYRSVESQRYLPAMRAFADVAEAFSGAHRAPPVPPRKNPLQRQIEQRAQIPIGFDEKWKAGIEKILEEKKIPDNES